MKSNQILSKMYLLNRKEPVSVPPNNFNMYTEEERIIRQWIYARNKPNYSREEFCSLLRKMLLNMFTSNVTQIRRGSMIEAFSAYCQKFPAVTRSTAKILKCVISLHEVGLWANSFFPWSNLFNKSITIKNKEVQEYFASEPEEIVLARVHTYMLNRRVDEALIIAKNSLLYHLRVRKDGTLSSNNSLTTRHSKSLASADWFLLILQRKKSLSTIVNEVKEFTCHEGLVLVNRLRKNPECKTFAYVMLQIFLVRDLIHPSSYCCTMKYFHLWCLVHKEMRSSQSEIIKRARKLLSAYAPTSAHFYLFVDVLWKHFGSKLISLYVEFYIRGITVDSNHLEAARNSNDIESLNLIECHLARIFTKLSTLFSDSHEEASRECMFSAFSLRPKKQKLLILQSLTHSILDTESQHMTLASNFISPPTLSQGFYHPLLNKGVKCVSYFLMRDLVSSLEGVRRIDFQYNVFDWRNNAAELGNYVDSSEENAVSNEDSDAENASDEAIKSTNSYAHLPEMKDLVNSSAVPPTVKRKIDCSNKNQIVPFGISSNVEIGYNDNSNKKTKVQNINPSHSSTVPRFQEQIEQPYFMHNAIEDVIKQTLDDQSSTRNANAGFHNALLPPFLQGKNHRVHPFSLTERGKLQDVFKSQTFPTKTSLNSVHTSAKDINYTKQYTGERKNSVHYSTFENPISRESVVISPKVAKNLVGSLEPRIQMSAGSTMKSQSNGVAYLDQFTKYTQGNNNISSAKALNMNEALNLSSKDNYPQLGHHNARYSSETNRNPNADVEKSNSPLPVSINKQNKIAYVAHSFSQHIAQTSEFLAHQLPQHHKYSEKVFLPFQGDANLNKPAYNVCKVRARENVQKPHFVTVKSEFEQPERYSVIQHTTQHTSNENSQVVPNAPDFHKTEENHVPKFPVKIVNKSISEKNGSLPSKVFPPKTAAIGQIPLNASDPGCESNNSMDFSSSVIMAPRWETSRHHHGTLKYKKNPNLIGVATATKKIYNKPYPRQKALLIRNPGTNNMNVLLKTLADNSQVLKNQNTMDHVESHDTKSIPQIIPNPSSSQTWNPALHLEYMNSARTNISDASSYTVVSNPAPSTAEILNKRLNPGEYMEHDQHQDRKSAFPSTNDYICNSNFTNSSDSLTNTSPQYKNACNEVNASSHPRSDFSDSTYKHSIPPPSSCSINESSSHSHSEYPSNTLKNQYQYNTSNSSSSAQLSNTTVTSSMLSNTDYTGTESTTCCSPAEVEPCANCSGKSNFHASVENGATSSQRFSRVNKDICSSSSTAVELSAISAAEQSSTVKKLTESCENISDNFLSNSASTLNPSSNDSCIKESNFENLTPPFNQVESNDLQIKLLDNCIQKQKISPNYQHEDEVPYSSDFIHKNSVSPLSLKNQINLPNAEEKMFGMCVDLLNNDYQDLTQEMNSLPENQNFNSESEQDAFFSPYSEEQSKMVSEKLHSSNFNNNYDVRKSCSLTTEKSNEFFSVNASYEDSVFQQNHYKEKEFHKTLNKNGYSLPKTFVDDEEKLDFNYNNLNTKVSQSILNQLNSKRLGEGSSSEIPTPIICRICKLRLRSAAAMKRHLKKSHPNILQESMMEAQIAVLTNDNSVGNKTASSRIIKNATSECKFCGKILTNVYMRKHILTQHSNPQIKVENFSETASGKQESLFLDQNFDSNTCLSSSDAIVKNRKSSYSQKNEILNSKLTSPIDAPSSSTYTHEPTLRYNPHDSYFHPNEEKNYSTQQVLKKKRCSRPTNCRICLKTFSSYGNLTRHFKTKHPGHVAPFHTVCFDRSINVLESNNISPASTFIESNFTNQNTELKVDKTLDAVNFSESRNVIENSASEQPVSSDWLFLNSDQNNYNQSGIFENTFPNNSTNCLLDTTYSELLSPQYANSHPGRVELLNYEKNAKSNKDSICLTSQTDGSKKAESEELKYLVIEDNTYITDFNGGKLTAEGNTSATNLCNEYQSIQNEREYIPANDSIEHSSRTPKKEKLTVKSFLDSNINDSSLLITGNKTDINMPALTNSNAKYENDIDDVRFDHSFLDLHFRASSDLTGTQTALKNYSDNHSADFNNCITNHNKNAMVENLPETFILKTENGSNPFGSYSNEHEAKCFESKNSLAEGNYNDQSKLCSPFDDSLSKENQKFGIHFGYTVEKNCSQTENVEENSVVDFNSYVEEKCLTQSVSKSPVLNSVPELTNDVSDNYYSPGLSYEVPSEDLSTAQSFDISQNNYNENTKLNIQEKSAENIFINQEDESSSKKCKLCRKAFGLMSELSQHLELMHCIPVLEKQPAFEQSKMLLEDTIEKLSPPNLLSPCYESESELPSLAVLSTNDSDISSQPNAIEQNICCDTMESNSSYSSVSETMPLKNIASSPGDIYFKGSSSNALGTESKLTSLETCHALQKDIIEEISSFDGDGAVQEPLLSNILSTEYKLTSPKTCHTSQKDIIEEISSLDGDDASQKPNLSNILSTEYKLSSPKTCHTFQKDIIEEISSLDSDDAAQEPNLSNILSTEYKLTSLKICQALQKDVIGKISSLDGDGAAQEPDLPESETPSSQTHNGLFMYAENCEKNQLCNTSMQKIIDNKRNCYNNIETELMSVKTCDILSKDGPETSCRKTADAQNCFDNINLTSVQGSKPEPCSLPCETDEELIENHPGIIPMSRCNQVSYQQVPETIHLDRNLNSMTRRHSFSNSNSESSLNDIDNAAYKTLEYLDLDNRNRDKITVYEISNSKQNIDPNSRIVHPLVIRKKKCIETLHVNHHKLVFPPKTSLEFCAASENVSDVNATNSAKHASLTKVKRFRRKKQRTCFTTRKHGQRLSKLNSNFNKRNLFFKKFRRKRYGKLLICSRSTISNLKLTFNKKEIIQFLKTHKQPVVKLTRLKLKSGIASSRRNSYELKQDPSYHISTNSCKRPVVLLEKIDIFGNEITNSIENSNISSDVLPIKAEINILRENDVLNVNCHDLFGSSEEDLLHLDNQILSSESDVNVSNVKISVLLKNIKIGLDTSKENQNTNSAALKHKCLNQNRDYESTNCVEPPPGKKCCVLLQRLPS